MISEEKYDSLVAYIKKHKKIAVAFSGGVDSTFLLAVAKECLTNNVLAFTMSSQHVAKWAIEEAKNIAKKLDVPFSLIYFSMPPVIINNPHDRCYHCKKEMFSILKKRSRALGYVHIMDGTNVDDIKDYRPGIKALDELSINSPLKELGFTKNDIRSYSKRMGLSTWNKSAFSCLITRIPHNTTITEVELDRIEKAESFLLQMGFSTVRVRSHGDVARIEVDRARIEDLLKDHMPYKIYAAFRSYGYRYISIDILGYKMGNLNYTQKGEHNEYQ